MFCVYYLSFIIKKYLTSETGWFKRHVMKANEIPPEGGLRLNRIKKTSRILQFIFLIYFGMFPLLLIVGHIQNPAATSVLSPEMKVYEALRFAAWLLAAIATTRLLELYERGILFETKNVALIRRLGELAIFYGVITACRPVFETHEFALPTLPLNILFSPWLIAGALTIIIAWVMDEGRKIQEEQELTV